MIRPTERLKLERLGLIGALFVALVLANRSEIENGMGVDCLECRDLGYCIIFAFQVCCVRDSRR